MIPAWQLPKCTKEQEINIDKINLLSHIIKEANKKGDTYVHTVITLSRADISYLTLYGYRVKQCKSFTDIFWD